MMMKGPFRDLFPVDATIDVNIPEKSRVTAVKLLFSEKTPPYTISGNRITLNVSQIADHEIVALDLV
jgi:hypothetical protein